jgi:hypothetical protein
MVSFLLVGKQKVFSKIRRILLIHPTQGGAPSGRYHVQGHQRSEGIPDGVDY